MKGLLTNSYGVYYLRVRLHKQAVDYFGRYEVNKTLNTKDYKEALYKVNIVYNRLQKILDIIKMNLLSQEQIQNIVDNFVAETLEQDKKSRIATGNSSIIFTTESDFATQNEMSKDVLSGILSDHKEALANSNLSIVEHIADILLRDNNIELDTSNHNHREFMFNLLQGQIKVFEEAYRRFDGIYSSSNTTQSTKSSRQKETKEKKQYKTYREAFNFFKRLYNDKNITQDTKDDTYRVLERLLILTGEDNDIGVTNLEDLLDIQNTILGLPNLNKTPYNTMNFEEILKIPNVPDDDIISDSRAKDYIKHIKKFFAFCYKHQLITFDPSSDLNVQVDSDKKDPFNDSEILRLIDIINAIEDDTKYLYISYIFNGMRKEELFNSRIITSADGVSYFDISKGKNSDSIRAIPLHKELIKIGLTDEVLQRAKRLISPTILGRKFNEAIKIQVTDSKRKTLHSLRHSFATKLALADVSDSVIQKIIGHSATDTFNKTYNHSHKDLVKLRETINLVKF